MFIGLIPASAYTFLLDNSKIPFKVVAEGWKGILNIKDEETYGIIEKKAAEAQNYFDNDSK